VATLRKLDQRRREPLRVESHEETTLSLILAVVLTHAEAETDTADLNGVTRTRVRGQATYADVLRQCQHLAQLDPRLKQLGELAHAAMTKILPPHVAPNKDEVVGLVARDDANGFAVWSREYERLGATMAPGAALVQHSCAPTAAKVIGSGFNVELRALRDLTAGEEVTISYIPLCEPLASRNAILEHHFAFKCACSRCETETATGVNAPPPHAHDCGGVMYPAQAKGLLRPLSVMRCSICQRDVPVKPGQVLTPPSPQQNPLPVVVPAPPQPAPAFVEVPVPSQTPRAASVATSASRAPTPSIIMSKLKRIVMRDDAAAQKPVSPAPAVPPFVALTTANAPIGEDARTISELAVDDVANLDDLDESTWGGEEDEGNPESVTYESG
jgi:SET domain